jgi:protein-S-isoprenylcysteine O-methyltransferase Ste14
MKTSILFCILSIPIILVSLRSLKNLKNHGFYRFLSWECMVWLFSNNYKFWFTDVFSITQIISWMNLLIATYMVIAGVIQMRKKGKASASRTENELFGFEKTTELVDTGIFKFIRHPLYSSLLFLTFGIYFKNPALSLLPFALLSSIFLYFTAKLDEAECIKFFGTKYNEYRLKSKMFIPYIF